MGKSSIGEFLRLLFSNKSLHPVMTPIIYLALVIFVSTVLVNIILYVIDLTR
jgi:hypothetical protein